MGFDAEAPFRKRPITGAGAGAGLSSKRMYSAFKKWIQGHHAFVDVELLSTELEILSSGTKLLLENRKVSGGDRIITVIPVLQWNFPPETSQHDDLKVKTLTADQKIANTIFLRLLRDVWNDAHDNVLQKLMEFTVKSEVSYQKGKSNTKKRNNNRRSAISVREEKQGGEYMDIMMVGEGEKEKKGREGSKRDKQGGKEKLRSNTKQHDKYKSMEEESISELYKKYEKDAGFHAREKHYTKSAIHLLGVDKLYMMLKEDNDRRTQRKHQDEVDRIEEAR